MGQVLTSCVSLHGLASSTVGVIGVCVGMVLEDGRLLAVMLLVSAWLVDRGGIVTEENARSVVHLLVVLVVVLILEESDLVDLVLSGLLGIEAMLALWSWRWVVTEAENVIRAAAWWGQNLGRWLFWIVSGIEVG